MKPHRRPFLPLLGGLIALTAAAPPVDAAPFIPGNLAVVRVGDGAAALSSAATPVFIEEYSAAGVLAQSIPIPATAAAGDPLTMAGSSTSEGGLMRSPNGALLCFAGYNATAGTAAVAGSASATVSRVIGTLDLNGDFAIQASSGTQHSASNIRSGATDAANNFWSGGTGSPTANGGVNYLGTASPAGQLLGGNLRWVNIFNGDLYFSSGSSTPGAGIHKFTGLPTAAAASTPLTVIAGQSPYGFSVNPAGTAMYVADDRAVLSGGGIQRWDKVGAAWSLTYTLGTGGGSTAGARGLAVDWSGVSPVIFATTAEAANNRLITVTDTGAAPLPVPTAVASAGANKAFRGLAFAPISTRVPKPRFFASNALPPANGVYVSDPSVQGNFPNGWLIRNVSHKAFTQSVPPPAPGLSQTVNFDSTVSLEVSSDGGVSFQPVAAPATVTVRIAHLSDNGTTSTYDTEMLQLDLAGGSLPPGMRLRESPTRASTGRTTLRLEGGGYMIDSFFDIFTELSLDDGQFWSPSAAEMQVELSVDPTLIPPVTAPTNLFPPPNDFFASTAPIYAQFGQNVMVQKVKHHFFAQSQPLPALGQSQTQTFDLQVDMEISLDGGQTFESVRVPALASVQVTHSRDEGTTQIFDTEMLQLDIAGGGLPVGVMLRESPTRRSQGGTAIGDPDFDLLRIGSFFDIFTEISLDDGQTWSPASSGPAHVELQSNAPEVVEPTSQLPPMDEYASPAGATAAFPFGLLIKDIVHGEFSQMLPPPPLGGSQVHSFQSHVSFRASNDGGQTFSSLHGPADCVVSVTSSVDSGTTRYFDTEMLALNISGGSLPSGFMLRESPTRASLGRTSIRQLATGGYMVSSFFDIFVELSVDGGQNWQPAMGGSVPLVLRKALRPHFFTSNFLPPPKGVYAGAANSVFAGYANGVMVRGFSHKMFTQGLPPPPPGGTQLHNFDATVALDLSIDGGQTFQHFSMTAFATMRVTHASGDGTTSFFDTEMLALYISGGGLPAGILIRESPTRASTGKTSVETISGGYMIGSFFDIFTEISLDGGVSWSPSTNSGHVELELDPTAIPPVPAPTALFPPPNDFFASTAPSFAHFPQGIIVRGVKHQFFTQSQILPALGQSQVQNFAAQMDMELSTDGGQTFRPVRAPSSVSLRVTHTRDEGTTQIFDTEMLQLDLQGGGLPSGMRLRESPTRRSRGANGYGDPDFNLLRIGSFFDIFTEISLDGGQTWSPALAAGHLELQCTAPEGPAPTPQLPPPPGAYISSSSVGAGFASGVLIREVRLDQFSQSQPPPPPGGSQVHQFDTRVQCMISTNGGASFDPFTAPAVAVTRITSLQEEGATRYFDTEMLALDISGGGLPAGVRLRESPTRASLGRTSIRQLPTGGFMISSFFDIFTELSLDGGQTWQPSLLPPLVITLQTADPDSDNDGLPDAWEMAFFGNLAQGPEDDHDHDGSTNGYEYQAGTNPADPSSVLVPTSSVSGPDLQILFPTISGHNYTIECSTDLSASSWTPVGSIIPGDGNLKIITLPNAMSFTRRYYRLIPSRSP